MIQHAFDRDNSLIVTISTCILTLLKHGEFEIIIRALESGADEMLKCGENIFLDGLDSVVGYKTKNEFREMNDLAWHGNFEGKRFLISVRVFVLYSLYVCCKNIGQGEWFCSVLKHFFDVYINHSILEYSDYSNDTNLPLLLKITERVNEWKMFQSLYNIYMLLKMKIIKILTDENKIKMCDFEGKQLRVIGHRIQYICSCSTSVCLSLQFYLVILPLSHLHKDFHDDSEVILERKTKSQADKIYYVQFLIFKKQIEKAISILNRIIVAEGDYSLSVFICPKAFWESNFLDDYLREEFSKSSADYVVFPTNLYARYLLVNAYNSLGQTEQCRRNMTEFCILLQRYSSVEAFAPILNIFCNSFKEYLLFGRFSTAPIQLLSSTATCNLESQS